jgi:hypothetical protein
MKLSSVRITNFKSFADTGDVHLGQMNILVGPNNHGKSVFIQAVHTMQQSAVFNVGDIRLGEQEARVHFALTGESVADIQRYYPEVDTPSLKMTFNFSRQLANNSRQLGNNRPTYSRSSQVDSRPQLSPQPLPQQEPDNFIYTYLSKRKVLGFERTVNLANTRAVQTNLMHLVAKVARLANTDYIRAAEYEALCKAVLGFRISVHPAEDGNGQQAGIPVGSFGYIPIESMGEGVSSQLGLITDLCMADRHLFLIEEPENDIHPEGLKTLLNVTVEKSKTNQFIVSTHSNIVTRHLGAAPDSKIFEFESTYKPNEIPTSTIREVERTPEARIAVLRRLGYELSDFDLWDGWLIFEESSAEIVIRYLIPWFAPGLARVRTVAAGGISKVEPSFEDFRRLFLFAHLEPQYRGRAWMVVDGDSEGKKVVAGLQAKYKDWPPGHFITWSQANFEHYYPPRFTGQVEDALGKTHDEKRGAKKKLLDEVKAWCDVNLEEARAELETSAADVIEVL